MSLYLACATFAAGIIAAGGAAIYWDYRHPKPIHWDWSPERRRVVTEAIKKRD